MFPFATCAKTNRSLLWVIGFSLFFLLSGCGKKAALYHPEVDKGNAQSDQAFVFPPKRKNDDAPAPTE